MTKLTDAQRLVLTAAAARENGAIQPLPPHIKGGAAVRVLSALLTAGLITEMPFTITEAGRDAIGFKTKPALPSVLAKFTVVQIATAISTITGKTVSPTSFRHKEDAIERLAALMSQHSLSVRDIIQAAGVEAIAPDGTAISGLGIAEPTPPVAVGKTSVKTGRDSKQAKLIEMLQRPEGATAEQIAEVTGWQKHTIRGAISGALKKKLGLTITTERIRMVGPNRVGAPGSITIYRITG